MTTLFDYQQTAFELIVEAFKEKIRALAVMATGLGKTIVSAFWAQRELKEGKKGLFLCHNNGILDQAMVEFRKVLGELVVLKPFYGPDKDFDADKADIVFASFQTYINWKDVFFKDEFDFIIVDESHHGQAPTFKQVILYFKPKKLLGITATPDRMDLKDIREIFGQEVVNYTLEEAIVKGWLTQVEYHLLNDHLSHWKLKKILKEARKSRRVSVKQINETIFIRKRDEEIARTIREYAGYDKKTVIFCEKIDHAENFQLFLPNSLTYHSKVPGGAAENRRRLDSFREGNPQYILVVDKFNEGIDVPNAQVIVFLRCTDSRTIFYQQLGRGLRKIFGKTKVVVLDFVANCERLAMIKELAEKIKELAGAGFDLDKRVLHVSGRGFDFEFSDEQLEILNVVRRINEPFYETWQEASKAAIKLKIRNTEDYKKKYKVDPKLPSNPWKVYANFPGQYVFFGKPKPKEFYSTWQEASKAAIKLKISSWQDYKSRYRKDSELPSCPWKIYPNFPDMYEFLGNPRLKDFYPTWQEASMAVIRLGISNERDYGRRYKADPKLPSSPKQFYENYPGWKVFISGYDYFPTWQEASAVVVRHKFKTAKEYRLGHKRHNRLPPRPDKLYKDFPGWIMFLGKTRRIEKNYYSTWQEAGLAADILAIKSSRQYLKKYKLDSKLPSLPQRYYLDFPGWRKFLRCGK